MARYDSERSLRSPQSEASVDSAPFVVSVSASPTTPITMSPVSPVNVTATTSSTYVSNATTPEILCESMKLSTKTLYKPIMNAIVEKKSVYRSE